jgi:hypothetical protein
MMYTLHKVYILQYLELCWESNTVSYVFTAKCRKFETNISRKGISGLSPNFHIHVSVSELYFPTVGLAVLMEEICRLILGI